MTVDITGAPLMDARNCTAVFKHSLSNTDEYCKIHLKRHDINKMNLLMLPNKSAQWILGTNNKFYFNRVYS